MKIRMDEKWGAILVGLALALRGSSLLFAKIGMQTMGPFLLLGMRFLIAFVLIWLLFRKRVTRVTRRELVHCALIGILFFMAMALELNGLKTTPSTVTSFLECSVVIVVPVLTSIIKRRLPDMVTVLSAVIALAGVAFLTLKGDRLGFTAGELLVLSGAVFYSMSVLVTDRAAKNDDPMVIAVFQLLFIGLFAMAGAAVFEEIRFPAGAAEWGAVLGLAIICSGVGFTLQPLGQKYIEPEKAGLLTVFNPLSASTLGVIFLNEEITPAFAVGALLIILSLFVPSLLKKLGRRADR